MTTIIMIFAFPIGIYFLIQEKSSMIKYQAVFDDFYTQIKEDNSITKIDKISYLKKMLQNNEYTIVETSINIVIGEKKIFSIGWLFIGIGTVYIGLFIYVLYYLYFQKPHVVEFIVNR